MSSNFYETVQQNFDDAAKTLKLPGSIYSALVRPERVVEVRFTTRLPDDSPLLLQGFRTQHSTLLGPAKGGTRAFDQRAEYKHANAYPEFVEISDRDLTGEAREDVASLAQGMTWKGGLHRLPFGGGKGLVVPDYGAMRRNPDVFTWLNSKQRFPHDLAVECTKDVWRRYTRRISPFIGPETDILAPDVSTSPATMGIIRDEFSRMKGFAVPGVVTGKPLSIGGSRGRFEATALGGFYQIIELLKKGGVDRKGVTCAIQGFGNAGMVAAKYLAGYGLKVVAISDSRGGIYNENGLDVLKVIEVKQNYPNEGVRAYRNIASAEQKKETTLITSEELLELDVIILIPAAMQDQITEHNARSVKAKIVCELANGPTTAEGDAILNEMKVIVIPDILANAGGVIVSYLEWVQDNYRLFWETEEVYRWLQKIILRSFNDVWDISNNMKITPRQASMLLAVARVSQSAYDLGKTWEKWTPNEFPPIIRDKVVDSWNPEVTIDVLNLDKN